MEHFAKINQQRIVTQVIVADEDHIDTIPGTWIQTWVDGEYRKNFAGVGYSYDYIRDAFIAPQPYSSWILDESTCQWKAPIDYPSSNFIEYYWDESNIKWVKN
jgi:hypothetical protein